MSGSYNAPVNFQTGQLPAGFDKLPPATKPAIIELYQSIQQIIQSLVVYCGIGPRLNSEWSQLAGSTSTIKISNLNRMYVTATEALNAGAAVNLYNSSGIVIARNANATDNTKPCVAYTSTAIAAGQVGEIIVNNGIMRVAGLTAGAPYWLSTSNGQIANGPSVASGNIEQFLGVALTTTDLLFNCGAWIQH